ncbi:MAG: energy transducer TonB [Acidobacteriota bacterium]
MKMTKRLSLLILVAAIGAWAMIVPPAASAASEDQARPGRTEAESFELQMRILEGSRVVPSSASRPVTSSYLKFLTFANFEDEADLAADDEIRKVFSLKDLGLVTEASLLWQKGKPGQAFHMFRINGRAYLVVVTPGRLPERNHFHIEVYEQGGDELKTNLLDTEFSLPDKAAAVFGFEDSKLKPYFITLRVARWTGVWVGDGPPTGGVASAVLKTGEKVKPPKLIKSVRPVYPEIARQAQVEGVVILEATADTQGRVAAVKVLRSIPLLDQAAIDAVRQWVYEPAVVNGKPEPVSFTVTVRFDLDQDKKGAGGAAAAGGAVGGVLQSQAGSNVKPPRLVQEVRPVYPEVARKAGVEGTVIMEATADTYGRVSAVKVLRSIPLLDQAAVDALRQWIYEPMVIDGKPQPVTFNVTMRFRLDDKKKPEVSGAVGGVVGGVLGGVAGGVQGGVEGGVKGGVRGGVEGGAAGATAGAIGYQASKEFDGDAVRAVGDVQPPKLIKQVNPVYPEEARKTGVEGVVILEIKADERGNVVDVRILRSVPVLDQAAIAAVRQWIYEPLLVDGKPRKVIFTATVRFALRESDRDRAFEKFAQGAVKAEGDINPPRLIKEVAAVYPEAARQAGVAGVVILGVRADETGRVVDAMVLRSIPLLDQAAIDAVKQWVYEPTVIGGKATPIVFTVTVRFTLDVEPEDNPAIEVEGVPAPGISVRMAGK